MEVGLFNSLVEHNYYHNQDEHPKKAQRHNNRPNNKYQHVPSKQTLEYKELSGKYQKLMCGLMKFLTADQVRSLETSSQGMVWSSESMRRAVNIRGVCSGDGYAYLLSIGFPLPSVRTLRRRLQHDEVLQRHYQTVKERGIHAAEDREVEEQQYGDPLSGFTEDDTVIDHVEVVGNYPHWIPHYDETIEVVINKFTVNPKPRTLNCSRCEKMFTYPSDLHRHEARHTDNPRHPDELLNTGLTVLGL